jgi:hypothetical protein
MDLFWAALILAPALWSQSVPVYKNPDAPLEKRVEDLLSRMTLEEKVSQLMNASSAIERLDVPAYNWWNECLHGVARAGRATVFPEPIGLAATWDTDLVFRTATAISDEARAKHHEFVRRGKRNIYQGLTFWSPNINLVRDPRWGRGMETYGEDPYLTGRMAVQFIKGLQGDNPKYLKVVATAKHFAVHSGPEPLRHSFDAHVDDADLRAIVSAAVRGGRPGGRRRFGHVRLQPREWRSGVRQSAAAGRDSARRMGLPRLRGLGLRRGGRYLPGPQGGRHPGGSSRARRQGGHRPGLRHGVLGAGSGCPPETHYRSGNRYVPPPAAHGAVQAGHVRPPAEGSLRADSVLRQRQPGAPRAGARSRAEIHRAAEERKGHAAAAQGAEDDCRHRAECRQPRRAVGKLQRLSDGAGDAARGNPPQNRAAHAGALRAGQRPGGEYADA